MDLLLIGDGSQYIDLRNAQVFHVRRVTYYRSKHGIWVRKNASKEIDLSKAQVFHVRGVTYYRSKHGIWVRKEGKNHLGEIVTERKAFKGFLSAGMYMEAQKCFPELFESGSKIEAPSQPEAKSPKTKDQPLLQTKERHLLRITAGVLVGLLLAAYVTAVIVGAISASHQISATNLGVIVIGLTTIVILVRPQLLQNIQIVELGSLKLQLRDLQGKQVDQKKELDELSLTLRLLVTETERNHLKNLKEGSTAGYHKNDSVQAELRRLRNIGLITSKHWISQMPDEFDLHEWGVELTSNGTEYLRRWEEANPSSHTS